MGKRKIRVFLIGFSGPTLWGRRHWIEPSNTNHILFEHRLAEESLFMVLINTKGVAQPSPGLGTQESESCMTEQSDQRRRCCEVWRITNNEQLYRTFRNAFSVDGFANDFPG